MPSLFIIIYLMRKFGRKTLAIAAFSLNAITSLVMIIDIPILRVVFALVAKFANQGEWCFMGFIFMETYPTELRHTIYGLTKMIARIGAIIAPFIKEIVRIEKNELHSVELILLISSMFSFTFSLDSIFINFPIFFDRLKPQV